MADETSDGPKSEILNMCVEEPEKTEQHEKWDECNHRYISTVEEFVFISCATVQRDVMWKVRKDGNPHHKYLSCYSFDDFEELGYGTNREDFHNWLSFTEEMMAWKHL